MQSTSIVQPEEIVRRIRDGEQGLRNELIEASLPEIRRSVRHAVRSLRLDEADSFSIGLEMFNHAIDSYRSEMKVPFIRYAQLIIRNRLIDWYHRLRNERETLTFTDCESPDCSPLSERLADQRSVLFTEDLETADSLAILDAQLHPFGLSLENMVSRFPRHLDTRRFCIRVARELAGDEDLMNRTQARCRLPVSELAGRCGVPVKTIDKNRAGIIFLALLLQSDLSLIRRYLSAFEKEEIK